MDTSTDNPLVLKAAWCYYMEGCTQQEISEMLGISRAKVIRLLDEARERGVIRFVFRQEDAGRMRIERQLIDRFGLRDAFVVPAPDNPSNLRESIARAAAMYVSGRLRDGGYLNVGYGDTMGLMLKHLLNARADHKLNVVSLTGGVSYYLPEISSEASFGMYLYLIPTPLVVSTPAMRDQLMEEPSVKSIYHMTGLADMSITSVGGIGDDATVLRNSILSKADLVTLRMQGAVGDILTHFIDANGDPVDTELDSRTISTGLDELARMKNVVGVAAGADKAQVIRAALRRHYFDVLITDMNTAMGVLADSNEH